MTPLDASDGNGSERVLVTGGAGFIGANLVRMLIASGRRVSVFDDLSVGREEHLAGLAVDLVRGDVRDFEQIAEAVAGHAGVVHLAAQTGIPGSIADPRADCDVNVIGTLNVLEACRQEAERAAGSGRAPDRGAGPRVVFASSNAPMGRQPPPAREDVAPLPISPYGASKLAGEAYCLAYNGSWGLRTVVLRFGNVYGPYSAHKSSVVAAFMNDVLSSGRMTIYGDGRQTRDFVYVTDLCRAILKALETDVQGEVFQIASGVETSLLDLASALGAVAGRDPGITHDPPRAGDVARNYSAIMKAAEVLGWTPEVTLHDGLAATWEWFLSQVPGTGVVAPGATPDAG